MILIVYSDGSKRVTDSFQSALTCVANSRGVAYKLTPLRISEVHQFFIDNGLEITNDLIDMPTWEEFFYTFRNDTGPVKAVLEHHFKVHFEGELVYDKLQADAWISHIRFTRRANEKE